MANTYSKIYLHIVFAVNHRYALLPATVLPKVHAYMGGILRRQGHIPLAIGGIEDHVHCLIAYNINKSIPHTVRDLKASTSAFINKEHMIPYKFEWQSGYACFSYSQSHVEAVKNYVLTQYEHHKQMSMDDEIQRLLEIYQIDHDMRYIPKSPQ